MTPDFRSNLVVHADDLGETAEITRGIVKALDAGRVTSTSLMANMPATSMAIDEASRRGRERSFGVHLVLCEGPALTRAASLVDAEGEFLPKRVIGLRGLTGKLDLDEVETELRAQIEFIRDGGVEISHFDSHKHLHQLPGVRGVVTRLAREFGVERIRCTLEEKLWLEDLGVAAGLSRTVRMLLARQARDEFAASGLRYPDRLFDVRELMNGAEAETKLELLRRPGVLSEMVCHPGTREADVEKPGSCDRHDELSFLLSDELGELMDEAGVGLVTYWEC